MAIAIDGRARRKRATVGNPLGTLDESGQAREERATTQDGPAGHEGWQGEPPLGGESSKWDRPLTEDGAPWQSVRALGGKFANPTHCQPAPDSDRRPAMHADFSRSRWDGLGACAWHWGVVLGALAALLLALRLVAGGGDDVSAAGAPEDWRAFSGSG